MWDLILSSIVEGSIVGGAVVFGINKRLTALEKSCKERYILCKGGNIHG